MIARVIGITVVAAATLSAATPPEAVREDFEGSRFPPAGWKTKGSGSGTWNWYNGGGHARVFVAVAPFSTITTSLKSHPFRATPNTRLRVRFRYMTDGFAASYYVKIGGWKKSVRYELSHEWRSLEANTTPLQGGQYRVTFELTLIGGSHGMETVWGIDDVVITRDNIGVAPTSLGRVRALYR